MVQGREHDSNTGWNNGLTFGPSFNASDTHSAYYLFQNLWEENHKSGETPRIPTDSHRFC